MKKIRRFIKKVSERIKDDSAVTGLLKEVAKYKPHLDQSCVKILGKDEAARVLEWDRNLLSSASYCFDMDTLQGHLQCGFVGNESLVFYVAIDPSEMEGFKLASTGKINHGPNVLRTCPFFFMSPEIIRKNEKNLQGTSMPVYFTPWLHEYCHFIGYCLEKRPVAVALGILYAHMVTESSKGLSIRDIRKLTDAANNEVSTNVAETIYYLHRLDEGMANFLQELLLQELGFDPGDYFVELMRENPFYPYFVEWGKERFVTYIADWNNAKIRAPEFIQNFLKSFDLVKIERCPIGNDVTRQSADYGQLSGRP